MHRDPARLTATDVPVDATAMRAGSHDGATYYQHVAFQRAIRAGAPAEVSLRDGLLAVAVGEAGERSIAEGRPVEIAEVLGE